MRIQILGNLAVSRAGRELPISAPKQRKLLALLVAHLNRSVSLDRALETLYGDDLPGNAPRALRFHVSKLRSALEPDVPATRRTGLIHTTPGGYRLDLEPSSIDAHRFATMVDEAAELLPGKPREAASKAGEALALWRGVPLAEFEYDDFARPIRAELLERKIALEETRIEARLALGDNEGAAVLLLPLIDAYPYRESLYALMMTALYRSGRQADALAVYRDARELLLEDLGVDPGPALSHLEREILMQAPGLLPTAPAGPGHNLPPAVRLVGREADGIALDGLIEHDRFVQITGLPGAGKSALAIGRAHALHERFSDGILYIDVEDDMSTRQITERLGAGLSAIGTAGVDDGNAIRTVAGQNTLVLLDGCHRAPSAVRPIVDRLLADGDRCHVLATGRSPIAQPSGVSMTIEPLDADAEGAELLAELLDGPAGRGSARQPLPGELAAIARAAGGLPGTIEIAAAAIRIGSAGGRSPGQIERAIVATETADLAERVAEGLPADTLDLAQRLTCFAGGLQLDEILDVVDPAVGPVAVLDSLSELTSAGVVVTDPTGYRIAPVLVAPFQRTLPDDERRAVLGRAAARYEQSPAHRLPANAAAVVRGLVSVGDFETSMRLLAHLGPAWWQSKDRARFAELCSVVIEPTDAPVGDPLETILFFGTHAHLDLGHETEALRYAERHSRVAAALDDPAALMHARQLSGNVAAYSGAFVDARIAYADAVETGRRIGHPEVTWIAASRSAIDILLGDAAAADTGADEVSAEAAVRRQPRGQALAAELRGSAAFLNGAVEEALDHFRAARSIAASCGAAREEIAALQRIAECHTCLSDPVDAASSIVDARRLVAALGFVEPPPLVATAAILASTRGHADEARAKLADLQGSLRYRRPAAWIHRALLAGALVAATIGRTTDAALRIAALDNLGRRTGLALPAPWRDRTDRIRTAAGDDPLMRARSADPVDLIA